jgi:hypothetical protein
MLVFMGCWSEAPEKTAIRKVAVQKTALLKRRLRA